MSDEQKTADISVTDLLSLIQAANKKLEHQTFIPSLNKEVHLKPLNANHTKNIAKSAIEGRFIQNQFSMIVYNVLKDVVDTSISLSHINVLDKTCLLLDLRARNNKPILDIILQSENLYFDQKGEPYRKTLNHKIDLIKHLNRIKKLKFVFDEQIVDIDSYKLYLGFPSIEEEYQFESYLYNTRIKNVDQTDPNILKGLFTSMFINTITQYIKGVEIDGQYNDLKNRKVIDRLTLVENMLRTATIMEKIDEFFGKQLSKILSIEVDHEEEKYLGRIEIGPDIFLN